VNRDELPVGEPVDPAPARRRERREREGRSVRLSSVDPEAHAAYLFSATRDEPQVWTYLGYGPFADESEMRRWIATLVPSEDPMFMTVIDRASGAPVGIVSYMNIDVGMRHL
jgi:RimJ/RimL family protein N-acetyltransferase